MGSYYVAQAGLDLLGSSDPLASASQVVRTTGMHHCTQLSMSLSLKNSSYKVLCQFHVQNLISHIMQLGNNYLTGWIDKNEKSA
jgi:hypothetical protein